MSREELLTTAEAAALLRQSPNTLKYWRHMKQGPPYATIGRRIVYRRIDLDKYIDQQFKLSS